jgi:hypothetical protein
VPFSTCCSLTDVHAPLHALSNWSALFHFVALLTDMSIPLHVLSDRSAVFHFVASLTVMHAPLHAPSDRSAVFHFVAPHTDMRTPLHTPSDWSAVFHFVDPLTDMPHQVRLPYFTSSLLGLVFTPFTCSCCWLTPFLFLTRHWHCLCCCPISPALVITMIQPYKTPLLQRSVAEEDRMPKRFCNDDMVWIILRCKTQTLTFMGRERLPGKRIVACSARNVTTRSSVYQSCQVVVNRMLRQQGDTMLIIYQSCHAIVKQDDSHYTWLTLLRFYLNGCHLHGYYQLLLMRSQLSTK